MNVFVSLSLALVGFEAIEATLPHEAFIPQETEIGSFDNMFPDTSYISGPFDWGQRDGIQTSKYHFDFPEHEHWDGALIGAEPHSVLDFGMANDAVLHDRSSHKAAIDQAHHSDALVALIHDPAGASTEAPPQRNTAIFDEYSPTYSINEMQKMLRSSNPDPLLHVTKSDNVLEKYEKLRLLESKEKEILLRYSQESNVYVGDAIISSLPVPLSILDSMRPTDNIIVSFNQLIDRWAERAQNKHLLSRYRVLAIFLLAHHGSFSRIGRVAFESHLESKVHLQDLALNVLAHDCHLGSISTSALLEMPLIDILRSADSSKRLFGLRDVLLNHGSPNFTEVLQRKLLIRLLIRTCQERQRHLIAIGIHAYELGYSTTGQLLSWFGLDSAVGKVVATRLYKSILLTLRMERGALSTDQKNILNALLDHLDRYEPSIKSMALNSPVKSKVVSRPDYKYHIAPRPIISAIRHKRPLPPLPPKPPKRSRNQGP